MYNSEKNIIKSHIIDYLAEKQEAYEIYQKEIFELIIKDDTNLFKSQDIKPIFSNSLIVCLPINPAPPVTKTVLLCMASP